MKLKLQQARVNSSLLPTLLACSVILLSACSSNDDSDDLDELIDDTLSEETNTGTDAGDDQATTTFAFAATTDFSSGQLVRIPTDELVVDLEYTGTGGDIQVETDGQTIYELGRLNLDSLTQLDTSDTSIVNYQYSVNGDESGSNPSDVLFASEEKAYVLRYGSPLIWIVNPSAETEEDFFIDTLDLSAYDPDLTDADLTPNPASGIIFNGMLFVLMERLSGFNPIEQGYVAVFDIETDTEINTGQDLANGLMGIPLGTLNPTDIRYNEVTDEIYVTGRGNAFVEFNMLPGDPYQGGLFAIDTENFGVSQLADDGDESNNVGFFEHSIVVNDTLGYVALRALNAPADGSSQSAVHTFNPSTGEIGDAVQSVLGRDVNTFNRDSDGNIWMGITSPDILNEVPGFVRINPEDNSIIEPFIPLGLNPVNLVFVDVTTEQ